MTLRGDVFECLDNALANDYPPQDDTDDYATACDLLDHTDCFPPDALPEDLIPYVREWKEAHLL